MKRLIVLMFLLLTAALVFAQTTPQATIREMTGTVELKQSGSEVWRPARAGDRLAEATMISTGFKSTAILTVGSSTLTVRPLTRLSLASLMSTDTTETINVGLGAGRVKVDVKPPAGSRANFTVTTPSATASVRGTMFELDPENIRVLEGNVMYWPTGASSGAATSAARRVMVGIGQSSQVDSSTGMAANPYSVAEANRGLPPLPGAIVIPGAGGANVKVPQGTISVTVPLTYDDNTSTP